METGAIKRVINAWNDMSELEQLLISKLNNLFLDYMFSLVHAVEAAIVLLKGHKTRELSQQV
jgi:hypothetical protein